jgi:hypothetical protein
MDKTLNADFISKGIEAAVIRLSLNGFEVNIIEKLLLSEIFLNL